MKKYFKTWNIVITVVLLCWKRKSSLRGRLSGFGGGDEKWEEKKIGGRERESLP